MKTKKYVTRHINGIILSIDTPTDVPGYTIGVIEAFLPDEGSMTDKQANKWIRENNRRMDAICKFLNENDL